MSNTIRENDYFLTKILLIAITIKIIWIILLTIHYYSNLYYTKHDITKFISIFKEIFYIFYTILIARSLIYLFRHPGKLCIDHHINHYLFIFGILLIGDNILKIKTIYTDMSNISTYVAKYL